ncbi:MAG: flippase [Gemmatimonadota bacterium]
MTAEGKVGRNFLALGTGEAVARVIAFAATVYLARTLGAAMYGVIGVATAIRLYFLSLVEGGVDSIGVREIAADPGRIPVLAPALLAARALVAGVLVILLGVVALVALPQPDGAVLAVYGLTLLPAALSARWVLLGRSEAQPVGLARVLGEAVTTLAVFFLVRDVGGVARVPLAQFVGDLLAALFLAAWLAREGAALAVRWNPVAALPVLRKSWPLALHALLGLIIFNSDFIFLRAFRDRSQVGYYAAAYTLISFLLNLGVAYYQSLLPAMTRLKATPAYLREMFDTAMAHAFVAGLPVAVGGALLAGLIIRVVFGPTYHPGALALMILIVSVPVSFFRNVAQAALVAVDRQDAILRTSVIAAGINLTLNALLVPRFGIPGAASATLATECARTIITLGFASQCGMGWHWLTRLWRPVVSAALMGIVLRLYQPGSVWIGVPLGAMCYGLGLISLGGLRLRRGAPPVLVV